jgi:hypothetical protein
LFVPSSKEVCTQSNKLLNLFNDEPQGFQ